MQYLYQENGRFFAQVTGGLEALAADELAELGATNIAEAYRGLYFDCDAETLYHINYCSRLITRILAPLLRFRCHNPDYLYRKATETDWGDFIGKQQTFAIIANVSNSKIRHSQFAALRLKDGIVDFFRKKIGSRPDIDRQHPDVLFNLHIHNNMATISLDTSGQPLHKRGYRQKSGDAPMQETLAAAIIRLSGWTAETPLHDLMCGSGTLLNEALMSAAKIPSGYLRKQFGFVKLPDFRAAAWKKVRSAADAKIDSSVAGAISGSDVDRSMVSISGGNLKPLPGGEEIRLQVSDFRDLQPTAGSILLANPPYGIRMGNPAKMQHLYRDLGNFLKQKCTGCTAYIYAGNRDLIGSIGLRPTWKKPLVNGQLDGRLLKIELY